MNSKPSIASNTPRTVPTGPRCQSQNASAGAAAGAIPVSGSASGLTGSQVYFVRLAATRPSGGGTQFSNEVSFTTAAAAPVISGGAASSIQSGSAVLNASLNPQNQTTEYFFEYGPTNCALGACAKLPAQTTSGAGARQVSSNLTGLSPESVYHFRLVARNGSGTAVGQDRSLETRASGRTLPDNRGYELVSQGEAPNIFPTAFIEGNAFNSPLVSPNGASAIFYAEGTTPDGQGNGDREGFESVRGPNGWAIHSIGPSGSQAGLDAVGSVTADHAISFWEVAKGSLSHKPFERPRVLRRADGTFERIAIGSLGEDPEGEVKFATPGGTHIIFATQPGTAVKLEENAPPNGTATIYDRTDDGTTHVVSLLPAPEPETPSAGQDATFLAASEDGTAVVFQIGTGGSAKTYIRLDNSTTKEVASGRITFDGVSEGGQRVFYVQNGELFVFETGTATSTPIGGAGNEATVVNVSRDGNYVYFISPAVLALGGQASQPNIYVWDGTTVSFVATVAFQDLEGLTLWSRAITTRGLGSDPSRTTPSGTVFVFQAHEVAGFPYASDGHSEIYRYDAEAKGLSCVSCSPTEAPAESEAELQEINRLNAPTTPFSRVYNVTDNGNEVFFTTGDGLVPDDINGVTDVYEWKNGFISLISTGRDRSPSYLFSMTPEGSDVLFRTSQSLLPADRDGGSASIYDARVGGGFAESGAAPAACTDEACQGVPSLPPVLPAAATSANHGPGNLAPQKKHHKKKHKKKKHPAKHGGKSQHGRHHSKGGKH